MNSFRDKLKDKKRIVIKIGSSSLTHEKTGELNLFKIEKLIRVICDLKGEGKDVVLVSSGAIAAGRQALGGQKRPQTISEKQAYAAVGQARLMMVYQRIFSEYNHIAAQVLLTKDTMTNENSRMNAQNTFEELLQLGAVPVVNENDTVSTHEIQFGDNDRLSAIVAALIGADLLILMSDIDGLYSKDPHKNPDGTRAVTAYFIMGRSENSRNRVFVEDGEGIRTQAFDPGKLSDPSLIIYAPVRVLGNKTIVTNGDQTDTIYEGMDKQLTFEQSLRSREFEPDAPNYTPRISGVLHIENGRYNYAMSILKSNNGNPDACNRYTFAYENPVAGEGHFIHTYMHDGNPLPSFEGEPKLVGIQDDMDAFTDMLWNSLNPDNKVSLFVRYIDIATGAYETKIVNKNK